MPRSEIINIATVDGVSLPPAPALPRKHQAREKPEDREGAATAPTPTDANMIAIGSP